MARAKFDKETGWAGIFCPACEEWHEIPVNLVAQTPREWFFNGNVDRPTFVPSLRVRGPKPECHFIVTDGKIAYCSDSKHALAGRTVDAPEKG